MTNVFFQDVRISDIGRPKEVAEHIYKHMAEMTILVTQLVVEFAKNLPGFMSLDKEDQIVLLKVSARCAGLKVALSVFQPVFSLQIIRF